MEHEGGGGGGAWQCSSSRQHEGLPCRRLRPRRRRPWGRSRRGREREREGSPAAADPHFLHLVPSETERERECRHCRRRTGLPPSRTHARPRPPRRRPQSDSAAAAAAAATEDARRPPCSLRAGRQAGRQVLQDSLLRCAGERDGAGGLDRPRRQDGNFFWEGTCREREREREREQPELSRGAGKPG